MGLSGEADFFQLSAFEIVMSRSFASLVRTASIGPALLGGFFLLALSEFAVDFPFTWDYALLVFPAALTSNYFFDAGLDPDFDPGINFQSKASEWFPAIIAFMIVIIPLYGIAALIVSFPPLFLIGQVTDFSSSESALVMKFVTVVVVYLTVIYYWIKLGQ